MMEGHWEGKTGMLKTQKESRWNDSGDEEGGGDSQKNPHDEEERWRNCAAEYGRWKYLAIEEGGQK